MTIEKTINTVLGRIYNESFENKKGTRIVAFETVKQYLLDFLLNVDTKTITDKSVDIRFTIPRDLVDALKEDIGAYIYDYINQRISYSSIRLERLRYYELRDKIEKAIKQS